MNGPILVYAAGELALALLIAVSNALVLWVFVQRPCVRTPTNTYIFSLALADFLAGAVGVPVTVLSVLTRQPRSFAGCLLVHLVLCVLCTVSTFHLLAIALDKYLTICLRCQLLYVDPKARHTRARLLILLAWGSGALVGLLPLFDAFGFASRTRARFRGECHFTLVMDYRYLVYVIFFATIIVPSFVILCCYTAIYRRIGQEEKQIKCLLRASERRRRMRNRRKLIRTLLILVCTYALCWFPLYLLNTLDLFWPDRGSATLTLFAVVLSHLNCALNPVIYAYGMPGFKHSLRRFVGLQKDSLRPPLASHFSQLPLPRCSNGASLSVSQRQPPYTVDCARPAERKRLSWTQLGQSLDSIDMLMDSRRARARARRPPPPNPLK